MSTSKRYCLDQRAIAALQRDGMGWGHDLDRGCVTLPQPLPPRTGGSFFRRLRRGT